MYAVIANRTNHRHITDALPAWVNFAPYASVGFAAADGAIAEATAVLLDRDALTTAAALGGLEHHWVAVVVDEPTDEIHQLAALAQAEVRTPADVMEWLPFAQARMGRAAA